MTITAIVANGPEHLIPNLLQYSDEVDIWIGVDRGALTLINNDLTVHYAVGDFDSVSDQEKEHILSSANHFKKYPVEKDQTDIEIAIEQAISVAPSKVYLFGVTGGRLDHELVNIQLLTLFNRKNIRAVIIDQNNQLELTTPGHYQVKYNEGYPYVSFIPLTPEVKGLTLEGFYYPLSNKNIAWGSTLCISNKLLSNNGTFSYQEGILLLIKSRDTNFNPIPT